ncbi:MAG: acyl-CoA thioesterase, partial [Actinomycetota bacterium]
AYESEGLRNPELCEGFTERLGDVHRILPCRVRAVPRVPGTGEAFGAPIVEASATAGHRAPARIVESSRFSVGYRNSGCAKALGPDPEDGMPQGLLTTYVGVVYPWQCDQVGHMNVASYVGKFDEATWQLFAHLGMDGSYFRERLGGMGAVEQRITYVREVHPGDCVQVVSGISEVRTRVLTYRHDMTESASGEPVASCSITAVHIDPATRRASALPERVFRRASSLLEQGRRTDTRPPPGTGDDDANV